MDRVLRDIPHLVEVLREQSKRCKDKVVPAAAIDFVSDGDLLARIENGAYRIQEQAHAQFGAKYGIPMVYYSAMREKKAFHLLSINLNYWGKSPEILQKRYLVRFMDDSIRAFLSDRYRPISHLDVLTTAVQVISGKDGDREEPHARGARCFGWHVSPTRLDVAIMNPSIQIDLDHLERGVQYNRAGLYDPDAPNHGWIRPEKGDPDQHWVFPAAFIGNSETGHGGLSVQVGLYEAICDNTARIGINLAQRHLGKTLEEDDFLSSETYRKMNAVIFAKVADVISNAFDPRLLLDNARKMKSLAVVEVGVKEALDNIVTLPGMTEDLRDDILAAYQPLGDKETLLDVQRAVTAAAHAVRQADPDKAIMLEEFGGAIIERGRAALVP